MSFGRPRATTNPYIVQLFEGLAAHPAVEPLLFSWRRAFRGEYDVFHVQWVEAMLDGRTPLRRRTKGLLFLLLLVSMRLRGIKLVRTAHNLVPHERHRGLRGLAIRLTERWTDAVIRLNEHTGLADEAATITIAHGHYRDWLAPHRVEVTPVPRRVLYFGLIRAYKGLEDLLEVMASDPDADLELRIVGSPQDEVIAARVRAAAAVDPRVTCELTYVDDATLAREVLSSAVVVLPYRAMHNSGALLLALSLDRPVLAPANAVTDDLAAEVGPSWVQRFSPALTMPDLLRSLEAADALTSMAPDLSGRDWRPAVDRHVGVYRTLVGLPAHEEHDRQREREVVDRADDRAEEDVPADTQ